MSPVAQQVFNDLESSLEPFLLIPNEPGEKDALPERSTQEQHGYGTSENDQTQ